MESTTDPGREKRGCRPPAHLNDYFTDEYSVWWEERRTATGGDRKEEESSGSEDSSSEEESSSDDEVNKAEDDGESEESIIEEEADQKCKKIHCALQVQYCSLLPCCVFVSFLFMIFIFSV